MTEKSAARIADAIHSSLTSGVLSNRNLENATIVDAMADLSNAAEQIAEAITFGKGKSSARDANGGSVASLTEAVMGVTAGLFAIAESIGRLANSIGEQKDR